MSKCLNCFATPVCSAYNGHHGVSDEACKLVEEKFTSTNTGSPKCEQCIHWNTEHGHHETECYSCKRYHVDMFTLRASA